jgi:hypothetical protein
MSLFESNKLPNQQILVYRSQLHVMLEALRTHLFVLLLKYNCNNSFYYYKINKR